MPLVNAKFRIKWKFKGATSSTHGLEGAGDEDDAGSIFNEEASGPRRFLHPRTAISNTPPPDRSRSRSGSPSRDSADDSSNSNHRTHQNTYSPPQSPPLSPSDVRTPNPNRTPLATHSSTFAFTPPFSPTSEQIYPSRLSDGPLLSLGPSHSPTIDDLSSPTAGTGRRRGGGDLTYMHPVPAHPRNEPKGTTSLVPLRSHTATFDRQIQCPVAIPLRSTPNGRYQLQPSPVKLAIKQEVVGDDGKKGEAKTGEVILDLSQFVRNGKREEGTPRRYLLLNCKTNATLRVTVKMEWVGGEQDFIA